MEGKKHKIGNIAAIILTAIAGFADLFSLIPFVGDFVGPIFWVGASIYFWKSGMGIISGRRLATAAISTLAELIPVVQAFPSLILGVLIIIGMTRVEDKTGISITSLAKGKPGISKDGVTPPRLGPPRLNSEPGIRYPNRS